MFRADFGAVAHESTGPDAVRAVQLSHTLLLAVVAAIFVIAMRQRNCSRSNELRVQAELRTRGVTQTAVDATGELMIFRHLRRSLGVWTLIRSTRVTNDIRLDRFQTFDEVRHIDDQIAFNREVAQRFNLHTVGVITQEGFARQFRHVVDHHAARAANCHTAGPAIAQVWCQVIFDVAQRIQQRRGFIIRNFIESTVRRGIGFRVIAHHLNFQVFQLSHSPSPSYRLLPLRHRKHV